jgi:NCAIR mutase (PurE)-related protein
MNEDALRELLTQVRAGTVGLDEALERLRDLPFEDIGFAHIDHHRQLRCGFPEVVFAQGKTPEQTAQILARLAAAGGTALATRATPAHFATVQSLLPSAQYYETARIIATGPKPEPVDNRYIALLSAGTSDMPVAEEAALTAEYFGVRVERIYDVGVAGLHRLLSHAQQINGATVVIVVAGMEGALASVVGGLVSVPVVAVPTSVGYGASFNGLAPLLTMLNSCAAGVAVVNIDNGFGAAYFASTILRTTSRPTLGGKD